MNEIKRMLLMDSLVRHYVEILTAATEEERIFAEKYAETSCEDLSATDRKTSMQWARQEVRSAASARPVK